MSLQAGQPFGKYAIRSLLGRGGMAEVYLARDPDLERDIAIKVLHAQYADEPGFLQRFRHEARAVARLRHPAIIQVFDFDVAEGQPFMAMEYLPGGSLKDRLVRARAAGAPIPQSDVLQIARVIGAALDYAHEAGMVHRDVKPSNILFTAAGEPVLADFGIARITGQTLHTATGSVTGTPTYMAPEQGQGMADARSDLYSLAIVLYEMLAGRPPFSAETPTEMLYKHLQIEPPSPLTWRGDLPEALDPIFTKALAKQGRERYDSGNALALELEDALGEQAATAAAAIQDSATVRDAPSPVAQTPTPAPAPMPAAKPPPRSAPPPQSVAPPQPVAPAVEPDPPKPQSNAAQRAIGGLAVVSEVLAPMLGKQALTYDAAHQTRRERLTALLAIVGIILAAAQYLASTLDLLSRSLAGLWTALPVVMFIALGMGAVGAIATLRSAAPARTKRIAGGALIAMALAGGGWLGWQAFERIRPPAGPIVLIADFERCATCPEVEYGKRIYQRVKQETDRLKLPNTEVRRVLDTFPDADAARARGLENKAVVVIWGSYDSAGVLTHLEVLETPSLELPFILPLALVTTPGQGVRVAAHAPPTYPSYLLRPEDLATSDFRLEGGERQAAFVALLGLGMTRFSVGDDTNAVALIDAAVETLPKTAQGAPNLEHAYLLRAVSQMRSGRPQSEIIASLDRAVQANPNLAMAHRLLAVNYLTYCSADGKSGYDKALAEAETAVRLTADPGSLWTFGTVQFQVGRYGDAAVSFERLLQQSDDSEARAWLISAYRKAGRLQQAEREARRLSSDLQDASRTDEVQRFRGAAAQLYETGDYAGATLEYQRALSRAVELAREPSELASIHLDSAFSRMAQEQYAEALSEFEQAQALTGPRWTHWASKGLAYLLSKQAARAEEAFREALAVNACDYSAQYYLGTLYGAQQQPLKAIDAFRRAAALEPFNGLPWLDIGGQYAAMGNTPEFNAAYHKALPLLQEQARQEPLNANFAYLVGSAHFLLEEYEQALAAFRAYLALEPADGNGHYYAGAALLYLKRYADAIPELEIALKSFPNDALTLTQLADAYRMAGRNGDAFPLYQKAAAADPQLIGAWLGIATIAAPNGNWSEAARAYEALVGLSPNSAERRADLAYAYMQLKRYGEAAREYHAAAQIPPGNLLYRAGEAWALAMNGQPDSAIPLAKEVLGSPSKDNLSESLAQFALGVAYKGKGQKTEALTAFKAAAQISPLKELRDMAEAEIAALRE